MSLKRMLLVAMLAFTMLLSAGVVWAGGSVYYGPGGANSSGCGTSTPCRTYSYAANRACQLSESSGEAYSVYHTDYGYVGYCDKSGGGGVEPGAFEPGAPRNLGSILWPTLGMLVAGFILGSVTLRRR